MHKAILAFSAFASAILAAPTPAADTSRYTIGYASFAPLNTGIFIANSDGSGERLLVSDPSMDVNPSFSADGQSVLFTSRRRGSSDLYRVHLDGTHLQRLTDHEAFDDQAAMSPDGKRVAFVSSRSGQADIWLMELPSRRVRNLTNHPGGDYRPAWSHDGNWLAFTSDRHTAGATAHTGFDFAPYQQTQIYLMRADGTQVKAVTQGDSVVGGASWSPDGKNIVFYEAARNAWRILSRTFPAGGNVSSQIVSVEISSGVQTVLTTGAGRKLAPQWLAPKRIAYLRSDTEERNQGPDSGDRASDYWSERIVFTDGNDGPHGKFASVHWSSDGQRMVFHRALEDSAPPVRQVHSRDPHFRLLQTGSFPSFSPDGKHIAFSNSGYRVGGTAEAPSLNVGPTRLFVSDSDGSNLRVLFADAKQGAVGASWSRDGDHIAFGIGLTQPRPGRFGPAQIALINADGSGFRRLAGDENGNYQFPNWSPDCKQLVLRVANPSTKGLSILDVETEKLTTLTPDSSSDNLPAWSPLGDVIAFTSNRDGDWDIYTIRPDGTGVKRLTDTAGNDAHAAWSPDGQWLAFGSARGGFKDEGARGGGGQGATDIFVMRADGTDVRRLTDDAAEEGTPAFAWKTPESE